ncbi:hypothetical protein LOZ57_005629 [Ophidiomyces ophidiicola]|uniref:uncharacterized protein n=1 Tax=Ophidiomyces ophidiicola TaxID=1387563 RepID=UPI0020C26134|nr:uncharacterized protein LOZ57_005629 [Ophidiomyces ophidiicola]KAI1941501.1 hypothetical protein LOZ57_005629 [Ophidiomyces ophidiicola]KAI2057328.1 hypothetical protein LOZ43_003168 [Ophidiomyces ophidiicola]
MEFPTAAVTNFRMTDVYSTIHWRIYAVDTRQASSSEAERLGIPNSTFVNELEFVVLELRNRGCLVETVTGKEAFWIFSHDGEFDKLLRFSTVENDRSINSLQINGISFKQLHTDFTPLAYLMKRLVTEPHGGIFSPLIQQTLANAKANYPINREAVSSSAFYKALTTAIAGLLSLRATQVHGAIPLGKRSIFTTKKSTKLSTKHDHTDHLPLGCTSLLSTLSIELSFKTLILSWRTASQDGLQQLLPYLKLKAENNISLHETIWLAPTGLACRFVGLDTSISSASQCAPSSDNCTSGSKLRGLSVYPREWKTYVCLWLHKLALCSEDPETEKWIEVETLNSLGAQLYEGERKIRKVATYQKFLWPARLCFKRLAKQPQNPPRSIEYLQGRTMDPLHFAEKWFKIATSEETLESKKAVRETQMSDAPPLGMTATPSNSSDLSTSLARKINLPELSSGAVYPTPPDGTSGSNQGPAYDGLSILGVPAVSHNRDQNESSTMSPGLSNTGRLAASAPLPGVCETASTMEIGSGMYDTAADEGLFDELDNFEAKEITEADFNFFDEPDLSDMDIEKSDDAHQDSREALKVDNIKPLAGIDIEAETGPIGDQRAESARLEIPQHHPDSLHPSPMFSEVEPSADRRGDSVLGYEDSLPTLSPLHIKEILFSDNHFSSPTIEHRSASIKNTRKAGRDYGPILFRKDLLASDEKYGINGKFWFVASSDSPKANDTTKLHVSEIPTLGIPELRTKTPHVHGSTAESVSGVRPPSPSTTESSEDENEFGNTPLSSDNISPSFRLFLDRKDNGQVFQDKDFPSPLDNSSTNTGASRTGMDANTLLLLRNLVFRGTDWSFDGLFPVTCRYLPTLLQKKDLIQVAQLVLDQITQSSLRHTSSTNVDSDINFEDDILPLSVTDEDTWHGEFSTVNLKRYTAVDEDTWVPGPRKDPRYITLGSMSKLDPPHIHIHRGKNFLDVLPPAVLFWEPFGFGPTQGQKDIISYCIHPQSAKKGAEAFLESLGSSYSSASLGQHSLPPDSNGLISWEFDSKINQDYNAAMDRLRHTCEYLGSRISTISPGSNNIVVYIVNPFSHEAAIVDICAAFVCLFRKYMSNLDKRTIALNEIVLQIVPLSFIACLASLVVPPPRDYLHLAFEVYGRCPPKNRSADRLACAPPFTLANSTPRIIPFKLSADPGSPLAEKNSIHVALSHSPDQRWIAVSWTDNIGKSQLTMAYCLRQKGSSVSRPISEVRADIWDITRDIINNSHSFWRVIMVKDDPVEPEELEAWISLAQQHNQTRLTKIELTLLNINIKPCLRLKIPPPPLQITPLLTTNIFTPVSTPNLSMPSPDPSAAAPTPPPSSEQVQTPTTQIPDAPNSDTLLIDKSDDTWSITLSHRINISPSLTRYHPSLASGYLIRRSGTSDTTGQASLCLNVAFTNARLPIEMLLKDILRVYRDLSTLARTKGIVHAQGDDVLPWHVSTAVRGREFLSLVL